MRSKVSVAGHPLHPMLVAFPIAFYTAATVGFIVYNLNLDPFWFHMALYANIAGVVLGALAAVPGFIDWLLAIPKYNPAKQTGLTHMLFNIVGLLLFTTNIFMQWDGLYTVQPADSGAIILTVLGLLCTMMAGYYGYELVQKHHIGVDLTGEQLRMEPRDPQKVFKHPAQNPPEEPPRQRAASDREYF